MTYRDIITVLKNLAQDHYFIKTFGYGNISDIAVPEDQEAPDYPYMFVNPIDVSRGVNTTTFNFNLIMMTQVEDIEDNEILGQSRCMQYIEDIVSVFSNTNQYPLYSIAFPYTATPFKERLQDDVVGATAGLTIVVGTAIDGCDTPFA